MLTLFITAFVFTLENSYKSSANKMEVSVELHLLFPAICITKFICLHRENDETLP